MHCARLLCCFFFLVNLKSCLNVFRSMSKLSRSLEACVIRLAPDDDRLEFVFKWMGGQTRKYGRWSVVGCDSWGCASVREGLMW